MTQIYPYNAELSYHLANLALAAQAQSLWEADQPKHADIENPFAIPKQYYDQLFITSEEDSTDLIGDIQQHIQQHYDLIGAIRIGTDVIPDYPQPDEFPKEPENIEHMFRIIQNYARRFTETVGDTVRYSLSNLLMGYALRSKANGHGIIVLRGTVSVGEWLNNMNYRLIPFDPLELQFGNVHHGFRDIYKGVRGRYRQLVNEMDPEKDLYFVGHSLGAAASQLAALDIAVQYPERASRIQVYAYASPRVGDQTFADIYNHLVPTSYRIINVCDVVPYVPFDSLGEYVERWKYPYTDTKGEVTYLHQTGNLIDNHVSSYHFAMRAKVAAETGDPLKQPRSLAE